MPLQERLEGALIPLGYEPIQERTIAESRVGRRRGQLANVPKNIAQGAITHEPTPLALL